MESNFDLYFNDRVDEESAVNVARIRKSIRDYSNPLELPNAKFISYFRLNKEAFRYVLNEIKDFLKLPGRSTTIPPILKLATALRCFADGSYQKCSGNDFNIGLAQPTVSKVLNEVLEVLENHICGKWIKSHLTEGEQSASKMFFFEKTAFPGIVGCVDGTHVRIIAPREILQHLYLNRKGYYSLNVMLVCDYKMNIRYVDARYPGANHDSFIWNHCRFKEYCRRNFSINTWILGDAGYPLEPYLMTPFRMAERGSAEARYNTIHARARNIVERTIGVLKSKFRCLHSERGLHYQPEKAKKIVNACCALHNISQHFNVEYQDMQEHIDIEEANVQDVNDDTNSTAAAREIRNRIMRSL